MDERLLLIDSDAFVLLAAAQRLDRAVELLRFPPDRVHRLPALPHMLRKSIAGKSAAFQRFTPNQLAEALKVVERVPALPEVPTEPEVENTLAPLIQFDATVYANLVARPLIWLHSADSLAMRRICSSSSTDVQRVRSAVAGRVVSLESILYRLVETDGYGPTADAFRPLLAASKTVACVLSSGGSLADPLESARSFLKDLCRRLGRGFMDCPPCPDSRTSGTCSFDS